MLSNPRLRDAEPWSVFGDPHWSPVDGNNLYRLNQGDTTGSTNEDNGGSTNNASRRVNTDYINRRNKNKSFNKDDAVFMNKQQQAQQFRTAVDASCPAGTRDKMPDFNPKLFNSPHYVNYNNCYAYAFMDPRDDANRKEKPQPGFRSGLPLLQESQYSVANFRKYMLADHPHVFFTTSKQPCGCDYYKAALFYDSQDPSKDYHYYRQDSNGWWSHKPGAELVQDKDASGFYISDPVTADRDYRNKGGYNYDTFVGYICIPFDDRPDLPQAIAVNNDAPDHKYIRDHLEEDYPDRSRFTS